MTVPTDGEVAKLRRMTAEPDTTTYSDELLREMLVAVMCVPDINGELPELEDESDNPDFIPAYDFHRAAATIWEEKAAGTAHKFNYKADGGEYTQSQHFEMCMKKARHHASRRMLRTVMVDVII